jgi:hypothetical protein
MATKTFTILMTPGRQLVAALQALDLLVERVLDGVDLLLHALDEA